MDLIIRGAAVLTLDPALGVLPEAEVGVEGGRIAYVRPAGAGAGTGAVSGDAARVIDGRGMALMPGFVNAHCHAAMTLLRGYADDMTLMPWLTERIFPAEARLTGEDVYWGTLLACLEMLKAGVTTFADMYFFMDDTARACADAGIRASLSVGLVAIGEGGGVAPDAPQKLQRAVDFARRWQGEAGGRLTTMLGPHAPYTCPPAFIKEVVAAARGGFTDGSDIPLHIHLAETAGEVETCRAQHNRSPIQLMADLDLFDLPVLAAHCVHVDATDRAILRLMRGGVAHNPRSNMKLASGVAPVTAMLAEGVPVGLGTDGAASTNALGMFEELRFAALLQKVQTGDPTSLPAARALEMATAGGARALGLADQVGRIAPGTRADLVLVDLDTPRLTPLHDLASLLAYSAQDGDVHTVLVDGRVVVEAGRVLTVDEADVRRQAAQRARRIAGEA